MLLKTNKHKTTVWQTQICILWAFFIPQTKKGRKTSARRAKSKYSIVALLMPLESKLCFCEACFRCSVECTAWAIFSIQSACIETCATQARVCDRYTMWIHKNLEENRNITVKNDHAKRPIVHASDLWSLLPGAGMVLFVCWYFVILASLPRIDFVWL